MKKWICLCLIMLLCAAACAMLAEGEALPASDEPPVEKNLTHGRFEAVGPIEEKTVALPDGSYCSKHSAVAFDSQAYFMQQSPHIPAQPGKEPPKLIRQLRRLIKGALRA